jgi:hypothetical protein
MASPPRPVSAAARRAAGWSASRPVSDADNAPARKVAWQALTPPVCHTTSCAFPIWAEAHVPPCAERGVASVPRPKRSVGFWMGSPQRTRKTSLLPLSTDSPARSLKAGRRPTGPRCVATSWPHGALTPSSARMGCWSAANAWASSRPRPNGVPKKLTRGYIAAVLSRPPSRRKKMPSTVVRDRTPRPRTLSTEELAKLLTRSLHANRKQAMKGLRAAHKRQTTPEKRSPRAKIEQTGAFREIHVHPRMNGMDLAWPRALDADRVRIDVFDADEAGGRRSLVGHVQVPLPSEWRGGKPRAGLTSPCLRARPGRGWRGGRLSHRGLRLWPRRALCARPRGGRVELQGSAQARGGKRRGIGR